MLTSPFTSFSTDMSPITLPVMLIPLETSPLTLIYPVTAPTSILPTLVALNDPTLPDTSILFTFSEPIPYITTLSSLV